MVVGLSVRGRREGLSLDLFYFAQISIATFPRTEIADPLVGADGEGVGQREMETTFGVVNQRL
jgi:hypothetical protein